MQRWEYAQLVIPPPPEELVAAGTEPIGPHVIFSHRERQSLLQGSWGQLLRQLGDEGWEMVTAFTLHDGAVQTFWFKRPLAE